MQLVLRNKSRLAELYSCLFEADEWVRMRVGDVLEKICRQNPEWLQPYTPRLLSEMAKINQPSVQWHLVQMLGELNLGSKDRQRAIKLMKAHLANPKVDWIVANYSLEVLNNFAQDDPKLAKELVSIFNSMAKDPHKSVAKRATKLLAGLV